MSLYGAVRRVYTAVLPQKLRHSIYMAFPAPLKKAKWKVLRVFGRVASHEEIYNAEYYATIVEPGMQISVKAISSSILETYRPRRVVDVGCGTGLLMSVLKDQGVSVEGMEYAEAACKTCRERGLEVHRVDLEKDKIPELKADVVVSTEVAEHLPPTCAGSVCRCAVRDFGYGGDDGGDAGAGRHGPRERAAPRVLDCEVQGARV